MLWTNDLEDCFVDKSVIKKQNGSYDKVSDHSNWSMPSQKPSRSDLIPNFVAKKQSPPSGSGCRKGTEEKKKNRHTHTIH
ncbi:hypothetical protein VNO77_40861 [Canavalia gladiata]|uniref:Uncharacterized protein n=1 Tax=Canavalia gladiata TaxID=3824 RepID=A0AAN9PPT9_CANGL